MHEFLIDMLICPACQGQLAWRIDERRAGRVESGAARCGTCDSVYPVQEGIGVFLTPDLPRDDLWEEQESALLRFLREHPDIERALMEGPLESLGPADQRFRATVLEQRGHLDEAAATRASAAPIYTDEYLAASASQSAFMLERLAASEGPIIDLASGAGGLVEPIARELTRPVVATDFSPNILRRDRARFEDLGLFDRVSLLAFDARRAPFRDDAIETLTSNQGLPNIRDPGSLLHELRRIVRGTFLSIHLFFDEEDEASGELIREMGLESLLYREMAGRMFTAAGWEMEVVNAVRARALPTPRSDLLGMGIDGLPVAETQIEFCVLVAR